VSKFNLIILLGFVRKLCYAKKISYPLLYFWLSKFCTYIKCHKFFTLSN
jgi:hypothetical protein